MLACTPIPSVDALAKHLGQLEVDDTNKDNDDSSDSGSELSDDSQSNNGSTTHTLADKNELPCPRSPIAKGCPYDIRWEVAVMILHERWFFLTYDEITSNLEIYCWGMVYVPTAAGVQVESQLWRVSATRTRWSFQLRHRLPHSGFTNGTNDIMGYSLVLASNNNPRALYREFTLVDVYEDIEDAYQAWLSLNNSGFDTPTIGQNPTLPLVPTSSIDPDFHPCMAPPMVLEGPGHPRYLSTRSDVPDPNQEYSVAGLVGTPDQGEVAPELTIPAVPEVSCLTFDEVEMHMDTGDATPTKDEIEAFVNNFRRTSPGRNALVAICKRCPSEKNKIRDLRPSNLSRHLLAHFGVKPFHCNYCPREFVTKDQRKLHERRHHSVEST